MTDFSYALAPFLAWLVAGGMKFVVTSVKAKRWAFDLVGYGGFPSNHSAIVTCITILIALKEGISHPAFGVALTTAFIIILDAYSLRQQIGFHAESINYLARTHKKHKRLREHMGHTCVEIIGGIVVGAGVAVGIFVFIP